MFAPPLQCVPHVSLIFRAIIDARNASPMTTHMIEDGFDNMRENAEFGHHRHRCASEVVQTPVLEPAAEDGLHAAVERPFGP